MNAEAINRKLAEWMGWKLVPKEVATEWPDAGEPPHWDSVRYHPIPNYAGSLDAVAEVEARLNTDELRDSYVRYLCVMEDMPMPLEYNPLRLWWFVVTATAAQRAEAMCRILGLWEEDV